MKRICTKNWIVILILLLGICSCNHQYDKRLLQAESLMDSCPDKALHLLYKIKNVESLPRADRAFYLLERARAFDKLGITASNDSAINVAVTYYARHGTDKERTLAFFYQGRLRSDLNKKPQAVESFLKALAYADKLNMHRLVSIIYQNLGDCYYFQDFFGKSIQMYQKALTNSENDSAMIGNIYGLMASAYTIQNRNDSARNYLFKSIQISRSLCDSSTLSLRFIDLANVYSRAGHNSLALQYLNQALQYDQSKTIPTSVSYAKAKLFNEMHQKNSAIHYFHQVLLSPNIYERYSAYKQLFCLKKETKKPIEACQLADSCFFYSDSISSMLRHQEVAELTQRYMQDFSEQRLSAQKRQYTLYLIIIVVISLLIAVSLFLRNRQIRLSYQQRFIKIKTDYLMQTNKGSSHEDMIEKQLQLALCMFKKTRWFKRLSSIELSGKGTKEGLSGQEREELTQTILSLFADSMLEIKSEAPQLNYDDIIYAILIYMGFSNQTISLCLFLSVSTLRSRKTRIKTKMSPSLFELFFKATNKTDNKNDFHDDLQ